MNTANFLSIPASMLADQEILVFGGARRTYGELLSRVRRLAASLRQAGVEPGDRVAALHTNSDAYVETYYAAATLGACFVPLNYRAKPPELEYMISAAGTKAIFVGDRYGDLFEALRPKLSTIRLVVGYESGRPGWARYAELLENAEEVEDAEVEESDVSILMYTSGTTSLPKGVLLTHGDFTAYVTNTTELADGSDRGTALVAVPFYHIAGTAQMMTTLWSGRRLVILPQFGAKEWLETVERERVTNAMLVPTMLKQIVDDSDLERYNLSSLTNLSYGGAQMPLPVIRRAIERLPKTIGFVNAYGQTETTSTLTILGPEDHRLEGSREEVEKKLRRLTSIGKPLPDVEFKVVDDDGKELPAGEVGEIAIRTARIMKGYAAESGAAMSPLEGGWLRTRDMGWVDEDGYIYLAGRKDDMIIRGGENIAPVEVESVLQSHPDVEDVAVFGVPSEEWGQIVAAAVVVRAGRSLGAEALVDYCKQRLASFKKPEKIAFLPELPRNPLGKVLKKDLKQQLGS
ncbi:MAG: class I adenylate-forming enzyme family protein [Candidatus Binatia bacterium]